jgi:virginiamycin B lyase
MRRLLVSTILTVAAASSVGLALAGGSNYGIAPGFRESIAGRIQEWTIPDARGARDPAIGPDGHIYFVKQRGDAIGRFNTATHRFDVWKTPEGAAPHGNLVALDGRVWATGNGNGTLVELNPATGEVKAHKMPSGGDPHTIITDNAGTLWFTKAVANQVARLDIASGKVTEYPSRGLPYGLALDRDGNVWFCQLNGDRLGRLDPRTGTITELDTGRGSGPRRIAAAPDGMLWVALYASNKAIQVDPKAMKIVRQIDLPAGQTGGAYAINVDRGGAVWVNEFNADTVVRLAPKTLQPRLFKLATQRSAVRKMTVDAQGRLWYIGASSGKIGVIE